MIRWCAYCQSYMGESEPLDKFSLTHGICKKCGDSDVVENPVSEERLRPLGDFFARLRVQVRAGLISDPADWAREAFSRGINPRDLLIGMLQPALYEIGELWASGEVSVATEHRFSFFAGNMVDAVFTHYPELALKRQAPDPDILLVNADGNYHTLGLQFLEAGLLAAGLKTRTVLPGLPAAEIISLARTLKPGAVGISLSMIEQAACAAEAADGLLEIPENERPALFVGGLPVKKGLALPPQLAACACKSLLDLPLGGIRSKK